MSTPLQSSPVEVGEMSMSTIAAVPVAATPPSIDTLHNLAETNREIQEYIHTTLNEVFSQGIQSREQFA